ncbi:hypothetical protein Q757_07690, partial [Oenococcus alcoholitolerans]
EVKNRLKNGTDFHHISVINTKTTKIVDDNFLKQEFVKEHGWDAVELKSPHKLEQEFGKDVWKLLNGKVISTDVQRVKYD